MITETSPGDDGEEFDALIERNWAVVPTLREMVDPGVRRLLDRAKSLEDSLNAENELSEEKKQKELVNLSGDWDKLGIGAKTVKITGRLRPTDCAYENDIDEQTSEGTFIDLSAIRGDMLGKYCSAAGFGVIVRGFDIETVPLGEHGFSYRVVLQLSLDEDYDDEEIWFTAYIDDIEYIEPLKPTPEGAEKFIEINFPEVLEAILTLPDDCCDPELIRQALDDFAVTFDMSHADTTMGHDEILGLIETYLSDRLAFDNASYDASIRGVIYGRRMNYDKVPVDYSGTLRQLLIWGVRLVPTTNTTEGETMVTYRPELDTWYLVPEDQGGRTQVFIPIDSLTELIANRPEARDYPFGEDTIINPNEDMERNFDVEPLANSLGDTAIRLTVKDAPVESTKSVETYADEVELTVEQGDQNDQNENEYERTERFRNELQKLHEQLRQYVSSDTEHCYPTKAEAMAYYQMVSQAIEDFFARWAESTIPVIEVVGEALRVPATVITRDIDLEQGKITMHYDGFSVNSKNILNNARGMLVQAHVNVGTPNDDDSKHFVRAYLEFADLSSSSSQANIQDPDTSIVMVTASSSRRFIVDLGLPAGYASPILEYVERRRQSIEKVSQLSVDASMRSQLKRTIDQLAKGIDNESLHSLEKYKGIKQLRDIALSITDEVHVLNAVSYAIESIIGTGRTLQLMGPYVDDSGTIVVGRGLIAELEGVISTHPHLKANELAFAVVIPPEARDDIERHYIVPLSTLEEMKF